MLKIAERPENLAKVANRVAKYEFKKKFHDFREGKKLLVLDIDYTLFGNNINQYNPSYRATSSNSIAN